ncbi:hypothetical protein [Lactiplantibacillus plantarum]|uniref:hypothetical protein n=1 Tax=Lactiplantibacillus plantarum TaxID=1590 RepID=UPI0021A5B5C0|nr:hypothetical protein [Lactiplantibacillus plantarum]
MGKLVKVTGYVDEKVLERIKIQAILEKRSMSSILRQSFCAYLRANEKYYWH